MGSFYGFGKNAIFKIEISTHLENLQLKIQFNIRLGLVLIFG